MCPGHRLQRRFAQRLHDRLAAAMRRLPLATLEASLSSRGVPCAPVRTLAQTLAPLVADGSQQTERFDEIHRTLRRDASNQAAEAVLALLKDR